MNLHIFAIYDLVAQTYGQPFFLNHAGQALRSFEDLANDPNSNISKHPADYRLFKLGTYNLETGKLTPLDHPELLANAGDFKPAQLKRVP